MDDIPNIARVAALIGYPARATMLSALMDGRALTASELAAQAGVTKQTASGHLAKLEEGGLIANVTQGRHKYFCLNGNDVATALEALMGVAATRSRTRTGPKDQTLRKARRCYDHLAGELGVFMHDRMLAKAWLTPKGEDIEFTVSGKSAMIAFGIDITSLATRRPTLVKPCLDWSMRRYHLCGSAAVGLLDQIIANGWASQRNDSRVITFTPKGEQCFRLWLE